MRAVPTLLAVTALGGNLLLACPEATTAGLDRGATGDAAAGLDHASGVDTATTGDAARPDASSGDQRPAEASASDTATADADNPDGAREAGAAEDAGCDPFYCPPDYCGYTGCPAKGGELYCSGCEECTAIRDAFDQEWNAVTACDSPDQCVIAHLGNGTVNTQLVPCCGFYYREGAHLSELSAINQQFTDTTQCYGDRGLIASCDCGDALPPTCDDGYCSHWR